MLNRPLDERRLVLNDLEWGVWQLIHRHFMTFLCNIMVAEIPLSRVVLVLIHLV